MRTTAAGWFLVLSVTADPRSASVQDFAGEYEVKAAYLFNFAAHVEWPAEAFADRKSPIVLCVFGKDPCGETLEQALKGKTAQDRSLAVARVKSVEELKSCHLLFVPDSEKQDFPKILEALKEKSVLVVGESEGLALKGAVFNFYMDNKRVRLEVNPEAAARSRLKIGAKLLKIARIVGESGK